eukprot:364197-Chlamydomonas_euryale.AAC.45
MEVLDADDTPLVSRRKVKRALREPCGFTPLAFTHTWICVHACGAHVCVYARGARVHAYKRERTRNAWGMYGAFVHRSRLAATLSSLSSFPTIAMTARRSPGRFWRSCQDSSSTGCAPTVCRCRSAHLRAYRHRRWPRWGEQAACHAAHAVLAVRPPASVPPPPLAPMG